MSDFANKFEKAKKCAYERMRAVGNDEICPFTQGGYTDPWLEWLAKNLENPGKDCDKVLVLQDWGAEFIEGELDGCLATPENDSAPKTDDKTLAVLKKVVGTQAIREGRVIILNAVWANRSPGILKSQQLSPKVHKAAFPVWANMVRMLCSGRNGNVFLCGGWAKWSDNDWGKELSGEKEISRWREWANATEPDPGQFGKIRFRTIPHPSSWTFRFEDYFRSQPVHL